MKPEEKLRIKQGSVEAWKLYLERELNETQTLLSKYRVDKGYDDVLKGKILFITELLTNLK